MDEDRGGGGLQEAGGRGQGGGGHGVHHLHLVTEAEAWNGEDGGLVLVAVSIYCHCNSELLNKLLLRITIDTHTGLSPENG